MREEGTCLRKADTLPGNARTVLWAAIITAAGALLAWLCGGALARALPAGGTASPLPVYTSLSLAAEDEPLLPIWQRYDPEQTVDATAEELGINTEQFYEFILWPLTIYGDWEIAPDQPLQFESLVTEDSTGCYLLDHPLSGTLLLTNLYSGRMMEESNTRLDMAMGQDSSGYQVSIRLSFPDQPAATDSQLDQAVNMVRSYLCGFLAGRQDTLLGIPLESWYTLAEGTPCELLDRLQNRPWQGSGYTDAEVELQQLCEEMMLDAQIVQLENEVLMTLTDRYGTGMLCVYYDARLCCVSGAAMQLL